MDIERLLSEAGASRGGVGSVIGIFFPGGMEVISEKHPVLDVLIHPMLFIRMPAGEGVKSALMPLVAHGKTQEVAFNKDTIIAGYIPSDAVRDEYRRVIADINKDKGGIYKPSESGIVVPGQRGSTN